MEKQETRGSSFSEMPTLPRNKKVIKPSKYETGEQIHRNKYYWKKALGELKLSNIVKERHSQNLAEVLPNDLYEKVCKTLDIPIHCVQTEEDSIVPEIDERQRKIIKAPLLSQRQLLNIERELDSDTDVETSPRDDTKSMKSNIHLDLLKRPVREQISWPTRFLHPEREDEKGLMRRADDLTNKIVEEFCAYMKELGGNQQSQLFTPKVIKELFQVEFDTHVTRSLSVVKKELPSVSEKIADVTGNPELSRYSALEREITADIKAEKRADNLTAFGRSVPIHEQWRAPRNDTRNLWRSSKHVPRDLVTLKTVWEGITNLRSVKEYCRWMIEHPEYRRASYLCSLGMFDAAVLDARLTYETRANLTPPPQTDFHATPEPVENIRGRLSQQTDTT